jgi:hypothetical protein
MNEFVYANGAGIGLGFGFRLNNCNISRLGGILGKSPVARKDP